MFEVLDLFGKPQTVYGVKFNKNSNETFFLFYDENISWHWEYANNFKPREVIK